MAVYVMSDIHGEYEKFMEVLEKINLSDSDTLYVLGDILDREPHPIQVMQKLMSMENAVCLVGNHELMALDCLEFLQKEITNFSIEKLDKDMLEKLVSWLHNGAKTTIDGFRKLDKHKRRDITESIKEFSVYEEVNVNGSEYLLVHGGMGDFYPGKTIEDCTLHDVVWSRIDYFIKYFDDKYLVTGHTPTQYIEDNPDPGFIYRANNHIAIDCGAHLRGGRLAALCLDTGEEFYSA